MTDYNAIIDCNMSKPDCTGSPGDRSTVKAKTARRKRLVSSKPKVSPDDFTVLGFDEADKLSTYNFTLAQLRQIAKHHKQLCSGNKQVLIERLQSFLSMSSHAVKIQRVFRGFIRRIYCKLKGPAYMDRTLCTNETDFYTLDDLSSVPDRQFISFCDADGFIYGFDVLSLYNLILKGGLTSENPYTRKPFPDNLINRIRFLIRLSIVLKEPIKIRLDTETAHQTSKQRLDQRITGLFQDIDALGNYTDSTWFSTLSPIALVRYARELHDIWTYRAQLTQETKSRIAPPHGDPFRGGLVQLRSPDVTPAVLKKSVLSIMENLVRSGIDRDSKVLGSYYVLAALTLVSQPAAEALPWLFESVVQN